MYILLRENKFGENESKTLYRASQCAMDSVHDSISLPSMKIESSVKFHILAKSPCVMTHGGKCTQIKRYNSLR